jgi:transposase
MRAYDPEVQDILWEAVEGLIPVVEPFHPLGCHRRRKPDRDCFDVIVLRFASGMSWVDAERQCGNKVSDTTVRSRRDEWIAAGVFDAIVAEALAAYDKVIGLDLEDVSLDGSQQKAPCGGDGTGPNPTDRGKIGFKWSILCDGNGIPIGFITDGANRNDSILLEPTLDHADSLGLLDGIGTIWLDRGYDSNLTRERLTVRGIVDSIIAKRRKRNSGEPKKNQPMGLRWPVERTNSWLSNYGQLRRNTDRKQIHRDAALALGVTILIIGKLIDTRNARSGHLRPIR